MSSPSTSLRKHLSRRNKDHIALANKTVPEHLRKTPSQKKSERAKQKELKRAGIERDRVSTPPVIDCHTCPKKPCGIAPNNCTEPTRTHRCKSCGQKVMYRFDPNVVWESCPVCRGE